MSLDQEIQRAMAENMQGEALSGEEVGAVIRSAMMAKRAGRPLNTAAGRVLSGQVSPGVPRQSVKRQFAGLGSLSWTVASSPFQQVTINPQRNVVIRKLVITFTRTGATAAAGQLVLRQVKVGSNDQNTTDSNAPVELFGPLVQENTVEFDVASPGVNLLFGIELLNGALAGADRIDLSIGAIVETVG